MCHHPLIVSRIAGKIIICMDSSGGGTICD